MRSKIFNKKYLIIVNIYLLLLTVYGCDKNNNEPTYELVINEFLAINDNVNADEFDEYDDWLEIFNSSSASIDIGGYYISDRINDVDPYKVPEISPDLTTIPARGYLILWCDNAIDQGVLHLDFKLSGDGESIVLIGKDGENVVDEHSFGRQTADVSMGRVGDDWVYFETPTPGQPN